MAAFLLLTRRYLLVATQILALIGFTGLVAMCLITMYDGLARYLWLPRIPGFRDFGEVIFAILIASCFPVGLLRNQNITITFLGTALGPRATRLLNLLSSVATLIGFAILVYALYVRTSGLGGRMTRTGILPVAPWAWTATVIMASTLLIQIWVVLARVAELFTGTTLVDDRGGATEGGIEEGFTPADDAYGQREQERGR